jgi:hypothetical protein
VIKWTAGELRHIVRDVDGEGALEVLRYLTERGPHIIAWDDDREPCAECELEPGNHTITCSRRDTEPAPAPEVEPATCAMTSNGLPVLDERPLSGLGGARLPYAAPVLREVTEEEAMRNGWGVRRGGR